MDRTDFLNKKQSTNLTDKTSNKVEVAAEELPQPQTTDDGLCQDLMMMCVFSTYYSGFYPDMSMFR